MVPAQQRLDGDEGEALGLEDRLVDEPELPLPQGAAEVGRELELLAQAGAGDRVGELEAGASPLPRPVERALDVAEQRLGGLAAASEGDAGAGGQRELHLPDRDGLGDEAEDFLGEARGLPFAVDLLADEREVVLAHAREEVLPAQVPADPPGDRLDRLVGRPVAHAAPDQLEAVEAQEDERGRRRGVRRERVREPVLEEDAVGEAGQAIVQPLVPELLARAMLGGDVLDLDDHVAWRAVGSAQRRRIDAQGALLPAEAIPPLDLDLLGLPPRERAQRGHVGVAPVGGKHGRHLAARQVARLGAEDPVERAVGVHEGQGRAVDERCSDQISVRDAAIHSQVPIWPSSSISASRSAASRSGPGAGTSARRSLKHQIRPADRSPGRYGAV